MAEAIATVEEFYEVTSSVARAGYEDTSRLERFYGHYKVRQIFTEPLDNGKANGERAEGAIAVRDFELIAYVPVTDKAFFQEVYLQFCTDSTSFVVKDRSGVPIDKGDADAVLATQMAVQKQPDDTWAIVDVAGTRESAC